MFNTYLHLLSWRLKSTSNDLGIPHALRYEGQADNEQYKRCNASECIET